MIIIFTPRPFRQADTLSIFFLEDAEREKDESFDAQRYIDMLYFMADAITPCHCLLFRQLIRHFTLRAAAISFHYFHY
jgi:hypothetical protein